MSSPVDGTGPVDRYLDELFDSLAGTGAAGRRSLAEAEDHLRTATAAGLAQGLSQVDAETEAVRRFGSTGQVGGELRRTHLGFAAVARPAFVGAWLIGGIGLVAMGLSGLLSEVFGRVFGAGFVAGDATGVTYTPQRCADYLEYFPHAGSCAQAAALHHWGEIAFQREAAGVLGVLALLVLWAARRTVLRGQSWTPPPPYVGVVMLALFGVVGAAFGAMSLSRLLFGDTSGVGAALGDGLVSGAVAVVVAIVLLRRLRARTAGKV